MLTTVLLLCLSTLASSVVSSNVPILGHLTSNDYQRLKDFFVENARGFSTEPRIVYHSIKGLLALDEKIPNSKEICSSLSSFSTPEGAYYQAFGMKHGSGGSCKPQVKEIESLVSNKLSGSPSIEELFYSVMALKEIGSKIDSSVVMKHVNRIKSKDSTPLTTGLIYQVISAVNISKSELNPYANTFSDIFNQADELDRQMLYFDRGLYTTAQVAQGVSDLITASGERTPIPSDKIVKLINFLYKRVHSNNLRAAAYMLTALKSLAMNPHLAPMVITSHKGPATGGEVHQEQPTLRLQVTDVLGKRTYSPKEIKLTAAGLYELRPSTRILIGPEMRGEFKPVDTTFYQLSLMTTPNDASTFPVKGRHELEVTAEWEMVGEKRMLLGVSSIMLPVHVTTDVKVIDPVLTVIDNLHEHNFKELRLTPGQLYKAPATPTGAVDVDLGFQLSLSLRLVDAKRTDLPLTAHQVFLQLTHQDTQQAITFMMNEGPAMGVAGAMAYKVRLDPENSAADFDYLDGVYKMEVIVGDFFIRKPILWHVANVNLHFGGTPGSDTAQRLAQATDESRKQAPTAAALKRSSNPMIGSGPTHRQPEIEHMFRAPEKRAPRLLALAFTALCAVPFVGLLIAWMILGVNVWNFRFRLSNIIFHVGLISIFTLYLIYWLCLDMFTTLRYLALLGVPTFLAGNSALRAHLASRLSASGKK